MRPFDQITRLGRLRRFHTVAREAAKRYGLSAPQVKFVTYNGNVIYRVDARLDRATAEDFFVPGRYVLRIHMPYHTEAEILSELAWLKGLRRDADLPVPEPVPTRSGALLFEARIPGSDTSRYVSLLKWLDGRFPSERISRQSAVVWGELMAKLHRHAAGWKTPPRFSRRERDWNGLFGESAAFDHPVDQIMKAIPAKYRTRLAAVSAEVAEVMEQLGRSDDSYGLIHADLNVKANVLFKAGVARVIDFDDCCFGYWLHDLAFALAPLQTDKSFQQVRDWLLEGYCSVREWPSSHLKYLDLFLATFNANLLLWSVDWALQAQDSAAAAADVKQYGENLLLYHP